MKHFFSKKGFLGLLLALAAGQADSFVFQYNIDQRGVDESNHRLPKMIDISTYQLTGYDKDGEPVSKYFEDYLKARGNTDTAIKVIAKTGPIFGKVAGKLAGPAVNAAVVAETGSKGAGAAAQKITQEGLSILGKGMAKLVESKAFSKTLYESEQGWNSDRHGHFLKEIKPGVAKCRDFHSMKQKNREHVSWEDPPPAPILVAIYNRDPITATIDGQTVKTDNFQLISLKWLYPMGPDPKNRKFFSGPIRLAKNAQNQTVNNPNTGKPGLDGARGGPFGSYSVTTRYQKTPVYITKTTVNPDGSKKETVVPVVDETTGKQLVDIRLVADFDLMKLRGGMLCTEGYDNDPFDGKPVSNNDFYPVGKFESDTTETTLKGGG